MSTNAMPITNLILSEAASLRKQNAEPNKVRMSKSTYSALALELEPLLIGRPTDQGNYIYGMRIAIDEIVPFGCVRLSGTFPGHAA